MEYNIYKINYIHKYIKIENNKKYIILEGCHIRSNGEVLCIMEAKKLIKELN